MGGRCHGRARRSRTRTRHGKLLGAASAASICTAVPHDRVCVYYCSTYYKAVRESRKPVVFETFITAQEPLKEK